MVSLMLILVAFFAFVCGFFFLVAGETADASFILCVGSILFVIGYSNFINFLLEELKWVF